MLLVEQGVLWVLPMLWLVLLLSEEAGAATATTGSRLPGGPGGGVRGGGQGPAGGLGHPTPSEATPGCPGDSLQGPGILTGVRVDEPECSGEQGPDEEGAKGDAQHSGQDKAFTCATGRTEGQHRRSALSRPRPL